MSSGGSPGEFGINMADAASSCVFCKVPFKDMSLARAGHKCEIKVLHCLHSACGRCLEEALFQKGQEVLCPLCDACLGEQNYNKYLCNFAEHQNIDYRAIEASRERPEEQYISCDMCVEACPAIHYCKECVRRLCQECSDHHGRSKSTTTHRLSPLGEQQEHSMHRAPLCALHAEQQLEFFCEACDVMCCRECILTEHESHAYKLPVGGLVDKHRQVLQDHSQQLRDLAQLLQSRHLQLAQNTKELDTELQKSTSRLQALELQVMQALQARQDEMLGEVEGFRALHRTSYEKRRASLTATMLSTWRAIDFLEKALARGTNIEVLVLTSYISAQQLMADSGTAAAEEQSYELACPVSWAGDVEAARQTLASMAEVSFRPGPAFVELSSVPPPELAEASTAPGENDDSRESNSAAAALALPGAASENEGASMAELPLISLDAQEVEEGSEVRLEGAAAQELQATEVPPEPKRISLFEAVADTLVDIGGTKCSGQELASVGSGPGLRGVKAPLRISLAKALGEDRPPVAQKPINNPATRKVFPRADDWSNVHTRTDEEVAEKGLGSVRAVLGTEGDQLGYFRSPCGMAVDSKRIYIADTLNHRIQAFHKETFESLGQVTLPQNSEVLKFDDPSGLGCVEDDDGCTTLVIVEYGLDRLWSVVLEPDSLQAVSARCLAKSLFYGPFGVGFTLGRIVVADSCNHRCIVLTMDGGKLFEFGTRGSGPGQFEYPECIATFSDGYVAVSDKDNHRIQVFDDSGNFSHYIPSNWTLSRMSHLGVTPKQGALLAPMGMVCDLRDRIYVADCGSHRVQIFDRSGKWLWGSDLAPLGNGTPEEAGFHFRSPTAMCVSVEGLVYVASDHCVQVF